jgi:hypothetical protein
VLLVGPSSVPQWCPDDWYVWTAEGKPLKDVDPRNRVTVWGCLSPWNAEAQACQDDFITRMCARYNAPDVLCIGSHSRDGEAALPPGVAALYDPHALVSYRAYAGGQARPDPSRPETQAWMHQSVRAVLLRQARIYCEASPYRELWYQMHPYYSFWPNSGNGLVTDYLEAVRAQVKPDHMTHLLYTVFDNGHDPFIFEFIKDLHALNIDVLAGSEWPDGLSRNTPRAIRAGLRGLLTAPLHPYLRRKAIEPWVYEALAGSRAAFETAQGVRA